MIEICRYSDGLTIKGHAGYAERGNDIVCAGISTLAQTLIQSIENLTSDKILYDISPGWVDIKHGNLTGRARILFDSFFIGCQMIANEYPYNVEIKKSCRGVGVESPLQKSYGEKSGVETLNYGKQRESFKNRRGKNENAI